MKKASTKEKGCKFYNFNHNHKQTYSRNMNRNPVPKGTGDMSLSWGSNFNLKFCLDGFLNTLNPNISKFKRISSKIFQKCFSYKIRVRVKITQMGRNVCIFSLLSYWRFRHSHYWLFPCTHPAMLYKKYAIKI